MTRTLLSLLTVALLLSAKADAQVPIVNNVVPKVMFGVKAGADFSGLSGSDWQQSYKGGFTGGFFLGLHGKRFGLQAEALIHTAKFQYSISSGSYVSTLNLDVPVMLEYKLIPRLWIQLGPQFTDVLSKTNHNSDIASAFNSTDFSGVLGLQAILPLHFVVGARYILGFTDQNNNSLAGVTQTWNNRAFQLYLGFRFL